MKKKGFKLCAVFVVTMMMFSLLPLTTALGASENDLDRTQQVTAGHEFTIEDAPTLMITESYLHEFCEFCELSDRIVFRLHLDNAKWNIADVEAYKAYVNNLTVCANVTGILISDDAHYMIITFTADHTGGVTCSDKTILRFPLLTKVIGLGPAEVSIVPRHSPLSEEALTFANAVPGNHSDNTVDRVQQVSVGHEFSMSNATLLRVAEKVPGVFNDIEEFSLILENAEWKIDSADDYIAYINNPDNNLIRLGSVVGIKIESPTKMKVTIAAVDTGGVAEEDKSVFRFPLATRVTGAGSVVVNIDAAHSNLSSGTYAFANATNSNNNNNNNNNTGPSGGGGSAQQPNSSFQGGKSEYIQGTETGLVLTIQKGASLLSSVRVSGANLAENKDYTAKSGTNATTVITLLPAYLDTLSVGSHSLNVTFRDNNSVTQRFTVAAAATLAPTLVPQSPSVAATGMSTPDGENPFADVQAGAWYFNDVMYAYAGGYMYGTAKNAFSPELAMSRGMIVTVLYSLADKPDVTGSANPFGDVADGLWYANGVKWVAENGVVSGYDMPDGQAGDRRFGPGDNITREQLAVIIANYMQYAEINIPTNDEYRIFADEEQISGFAKDAIQTLNKLGIIGGVGENRINPQGNATRAEFAAMLHRFMQLEK